MTAPRSPTLLRAPSSLSSRALALCLAFWSPVGAAPDIFPLQEVRAGLIAVGRTVFEGEEIEDFELEVLGVYENFAGPDQDVILARLLGERMKHNGVVAGMSGSPVYVDGRLLGALAYRIGSFAKEPLAGITPIEKMLPVLDLPPAGAAAPRPAHVEPLRWSLPLLAEDAVARVDFLPANAPPALGLGGELPRALRALAPAGDDTSRQVPDAARPALRPIDTPVFFSSLDARVLGAYSGALRDMGLLAVQGGGGGSAAAPRATRFEPGSAIAAQLTRGDVEIAATGTLTYLEDGRVLAFGHPFLRGGATSIPFAPARVLMTVPSLDDSFKLAAPGDSLGFLSQDRLTAVGGRVGGSAPMIPIRLSVRSAGAPPRQVDFEVFQDPLWSPLVMEIAMAGSLVNALDFSLPATIELRASIRFEGHPEVKLVNVFSGPGAPVSVQQVATRYLASVFSLLYSNRFETPRVAALQADFLQRPERLFTVVEDVWLDAAEVRPGDLVTARVFLRPYLGERTHHDFEIRVPAGSPEGTLLVQAGGGQAFLRRDQQLLQKRLAQSESLDSMIQVLGELPRSDVLYLKLMRRSEGALIKERLAPSLPPSVLEVLRSSEARGDFTRLGEETVLEQELALEGAVFGGRQAELQVRAR